jgi:guanylate kinase
VATEDFEDLIAKDGFVEHAKYGSNRYGTSKMTIEEQTKKGRVVLLDIEMEVTSPHNATKTIRRKKRFVNEAIGS